MDLLTKKDKNILFDNLTKELRYLNENSNFDFIKMIEINGKKKPKIIWGSKENKLDLRKFYIIDKEIIKTEFYNKFEDDKEIWSKMFESIANNYKSLAKSIIHSSKEESLYEFKHFNIPGDDINDNIIDMQFGSKMHLETDITNMYESTYTHAMAWSVYGREKFKTYWDDSNAVTKEERNIFDKFQNFDKKYRNKIRMDGESVGILTGQNMSDVLADFILTGIDNELMKSKEYNDKKYNFFHWKDNYHFFFYTHNNNEIYEIIKTIKDTFANFKYNIKFIKNNNEVELKNSLEDLDLSDINDMIRENKVFLNNLFKSVHIYNRYTEEFVIAEGGIESFKAAYEDIKNSNSIKIDEFIKENRSKIKPKHVFESSFYSSNEASKARKIFLTKWMNKPKEILKNLQYLDIHSKNMHNDEVIHIKRWIEELNDKRYEYESLLLIELFEFRFTSDELAEIKNKNKLYYDGLIVNKPLED